MKYDLEGCENPKPVWRESIPGNEANLFRHLPTVTQCRKEQTWCWPTQCCLDMSSTVAYMNREDGNCSLFSSPNYRSFDFCPCRVWCSGGLAKCVIKKTDLCNGFKPMLQRSLTDAVFNL